MKPSGVAILLALLALLLGTACHAQARPLLLIHPQPESAADARTNYPLALLRLALDKTRLRYQLRPAATVMQQGRSIRELQTGGSTLTVMWTLTSREREALLLPIRIPIDKGLFGWRVALIRADRYDLFKDVTTAPQLAAFKAGQGHDWPDTEILKAAGLPVETSFSYESLFQMLSGGRFDYFPRSILELVPEVDKHRELGLIVEPQLVIHYPAALYYFVSKKNPALAQAIQAGLERALKDGSFDKLFYKFYGAEIERAHLAERRAINLDNPLLPPETPLDRAELWFHPMPLKPPKQP